MSILSIREVSKYYGSYAALNKVSIEIPKASIFGLLGPNGAGKTSLIRIINQITAPDSGEVLLDGKALKPADIARIGYLPEERGLYPKMKVGEQLLYLARLKDLDKQEAIKRIKDWSERFEIESWYNKNIEELSKGMAQKVQFISTVIHQPDLLIFDEPFTGFDPINTNLIKSEIRRLRDEGATIIFSTHRMESVEEICDEIALINKGNKILEGRIKPIKKEFATNIFEAELENYTAFSNLNTAEILQQKEVDGHLSLRLSAKAEANDLAQELMQFGKLTLFKEEVPSLNDIFIQKVQS
ncbi:ABC transporter ATP-binding protein [Owenweeksia hongkongensis]|uniref:ABC transporter ATP-binding protein n=1 Tax=Owenweeksia hongkongensis TaxID=253245 RepID=UPI003A91FEEC